MIPAAKPTQWAEEPATWIHVAGGFWHLQKSSLTRFADGACEVESVMLYGQTESRGGIVARQSLAALRAIGARCCVDCEQNTGRKWVQESGEGFR